VPANDRHRNRRHCLVHRETAAERTAVVLRRAALAARCAESSMPICACLLWHVLGRDRGRSRHWIGRGKDGIVQGVPRGRENLHTSRGCAGSNDQSIPLRPIPLRPIPLRPIPLRPIPLRPIPLSQSHLGQAARDPTIESGSIADLSVSCATRARVDALWGSSRSRRPVCRDSGRR
jgi:hypothetical protein